MLKQRVKSRNVGIYQEIRNIKNISKGIRDISLQVWLNMKGQNSPTYGYNNVTKIVWYFYIYYMSRNCREWVMNIFTSESYINGEDIFIKILMLVLSLLIYRVFKSSISTGLYNRLNYIGKYLGEKVSFLALIKVIF